MVENDVYELQIKLSYLEGFIKDLNEVVIAQGGQIEKQAKQITILKDKIEQLEERLDKKGEAPADEAPPHY